MYSTFNLILKLLTLLYIINPLTHVSSCMRLYKRSGLSGALTRNAEEVLIERLRCADLWRIKGEAERYWSPPGILKHVFCAWKIKQIFNFIEQPLTSVFKIFFSTSVCSIISEPELSRESQIECLRVDQSQDKQIPPYLFIFLSIFGLLTGWINTGACMSKQSRGV